MLSLSPGLDQHVPSYAGNEGEKLVKSMFRFSSNVLSTIAETFVAYCETKLSSQFQIKDQTENYHQHNLAYYAKYSKKQFTEH